MRCIHSKRFTTLRHKRHKWHERGDRDERHAWHKRKQKLKRGRGMPLTCGAVAAGD